MRLDRVLQICLGIALVILTLIIAGAIREEIVNAGDRAPKFEVRTDSGKTLRPSDFGGKVLVLNFWATWCPPCIAETPSLIEMHKRLSSEGVVVLAVSVDRNEAAYRNFIRRFGVNFETFRDPEGRISSSFGTFRYPETYIIDRSGTVRQKHINERNWVDEEMLRGIRALL